MCVSGKCLFQVNVCFNLLLSIVKLPSAYVPLFHHPPILARSWKPHTTGPPVHQVYTLCNHTQPRTICISDCQASVYALQSSLPLGYHPPDKPELFEAVSVKKENTLYVPMNEPTGMLRTGTSTPSHHTTESSIHFPAMRKMQTAPYILATLSKQGPKKTSIASNTGIAVNTITSITNCQKMCSTHDPNVLPYSPPGCKLKGWSTQSL